MSRGTFSFALRENRFLEKVDLCIQSFSFCGVSAIGRRTLGALRRRTSSKQPPSLGPQVTY